MHLFRSGMLFNDKQCQVLTIRDISAQENLELAEEKNTLLNLMTSSISHELMTPIRCIITFAEELLKKLRKGNSHHNASMIRNTGKLLLTQIKMLLDRGLMESGQFVPQIENGMLLDVLKETIEIL